MTTRVAYLGYCRGDRLREIADMIDAGEITHAVVACRQQNGDLIYRTIGRRDATYLVGMVHRVALRIMTEDNE